jgi:hypothetical protein
VLSLPPAFVLSQDQTLKFNHDMVAECTFAFDEDTHLILSAIRKLRQGSVPLETCTHRKSCNNFHRNCFQLQFARTSPSTFLFLLSSQCQRADLIPQRENVGEAIAPDPFSKTNSLSGCPADRPPCQKSLNCGNNFKSFASSTSRFLVNLFLTVNRFFRFSFRLVFNSPTRISITTQSQIY